MTTRPLHIGLDGREWLGRPAGVGRYLVEVVKCWTADPGFPHRLTAFGPVSEPPAVLRELGDRISWRTVGDGAAGTWWEQRHLPAAVRDAGVDAFFAGGYTAPLRLGSPFVVAIYDVSFFAHPEWFPRREGLRRRWITRASARRASRVVTISEFSAGEIVRFLGVPRDRIVLAPPGAPSVPGTSGGRPAAVTGPPLVLFVGSLFTRRHVPDMLAAFARARQDVPDARLVLVGDNRTHPRIDPREIAASLGAADAVRWAEYVDDGELERLYAEASAFIFLSDYEGFAMTPMEALAHGVPSVLLDTPVGREVYGDCARFVPADVDAIASALTTLLLDAGARSALLDAGRATLARSSWAASATVIRRALEDSVTP